MSETPSDRINKMMQDAIDNNIPAHQRPLLVMGLLKQFGIELAAMTTAKELAERQITLVQDERAASFARLDAAVGGTGLTEYQPEIATLIECAIKGIISAKELAERQVKLLCGHIDDYGSCWNCPAKVLGAACSHSGESCREQLAAWSLEQAVKEGGKG
jgi:hypothetical protein